MNLQSLLLFIHRDTMPTVQPELRARSVLVVHDLFLMKRGSRTHSVGGSAYLFVCIQPHQPLHSFHSLLTCSNQQQCCKSLCQLNEFKLVDVS